MKVIAIANPKGGVSKSTTTSALAAVAADAGLAVLIIDLDPQGSATLLSGLLDAESDNYADAMFSRHLPPSALAMRSRHGYDVVPAGPNLIAVEDTISKQPLGEQRLSLLLDSDRASLEKYDLVLIDTAGFRGRLLTASLMAADEVLIPVEPSRLSTNELPDLLLLIEQLNPFRPNRALQVRGMLFTKVQPRTNAAARQMSEVRDAFGEEYRIAETVIPVSTVVREAETAEAPVVRYSADSAPALAYRAAFAELFAEAA